MWPRRKRWSLMGSLAPPITSRFGVAAQEFYPKGNVPSPNYEFFDEESGGWSADKNNAAINAAMARQAQIPQYDHTMGAGAGSAAKKKGLSMSNMIKALSEMKKPPDQAKAGAWKGGEARPQLPAPPQFAALGGVNPSIMNTGGLPDARNKKWWEIMGYS